MVKLIAFLAIVAAFATHVTGTQLSGSLANASTASNHTTSGSMTLDEYKAEWEKVKQVYEEAFANDPELMKVLNDFDAQMKEAFQSNVSSAEIEQLVTTLGDQLEGNPKYKDMEGKVAEIASNASISTASVAGSLLGDGRTIDQENTSASTPAPTDKKNHAVASKHLHFQLMTAAALVVGLMVWG